MRFSLRKAIHFVFLVIFIHLVVYYWTIKIKVTRIIPNYNNATAHKYLQGLDKDDGSCSNERCPPVSDKHINVHLIPHSHIDVGWKKTVEQYYVGDMVAGVWAAGCVRCTFNGTIGELLKDKSRRFIFVEMKYLSRYWDEITEAQRADIKQLIKERRLEIVNGGWVMTDAAVTMYNDIIDQHTLGFDFIKETLGSCSLSRNGWHVDQFGHSREHASIFAQMGFESLIIGRLDYQDIAVRKQNKDLELIWYTSPGNLKTKSSLFTSIMHEGYYSPSTFDFESDYHNFDNPLEAEKAATKFIEHLNNRSSSMKTNHLLIPMGCDFGFKGSQANVYFSSMDKLIAAVHKYQLSKSSVVYNLFYSTPSCYTYHVNKAQVKFSTKEDDFQPYAIPPGAYWTGYFTTRGGLKYYIKRAGQILQSCKHMYILTNMPDLYKQVNKMRDAVAIMQHHDAITGTQLLAVLNDYIQLLSAATVHCENALSKTYESLWDWTHGDHDSERSKFSFCHDLNISSCALSEKSQRFAISYYNALSWPVTVFGRIPVNNKITISDDKKNQLPVQLVPVPPEILSIPERKSKAKTDAVFEVKLPPMSATLLEVTAKTGNDPLEFVPEDTVNSIENEYLSVEFDPTTKRLVAIKNKISNIKLDIQQEFAYYKDQENWKRTSGHYLFVPENKPATVIKQVGVDAHFYKGDVVQELQHKISDWTSQVVRLHKQSKCVEFQWTVGPLDLYKGREIISRFTTDLNSGNKFFTDSHGREILTRIRKSKGDGIDHVQNDISGNYFPITSRIYIQDQTKGIQLTILPDRVQGGSSLSSGSIEFLIHRNTLIDDDLGLAQTLQDRGVDGKGVINTGKHFVCIESIEKSAKLTRQLGLQLHFAPVPMFANLPDHQDIVFKNKEFLFSTLPDNIQVLTLDRISEKDSNLFLIRLEHIFEENEDAELSKPATVQLETLFKPFYIVAAEETTLGGNFRPHDIRRMIWDTANGKTPSSIESPNYKETMERPFEITLLPMEIRTFRVTVMWSTTNDP